MQKSLKKGLLLVWILFFWGVLLHTQAQQTTGDLKLEITAGQSCCVYGTSVVFWEKDVSFGITEFTGDFLSYHGTTTWWCKDLLWTETWRAMYIAMSWDMENQNGNKISSWNVKISFDETTLVGWNCILYNNSGIDVPLNDSVALIEKDGNISTNYGKICELGTTNVQLKVVTNTGQAPGNYIGTLVIDLPSFANASCDELIGTFYDAETDGLNYEWDQWSVWITSNGGQFSYKPWEQITFKVWTVTLGNPVIPAANGSVFVTDLFGVARTEITDTNVIKVGKLLQWLDDDNNPNNGISISWAIATSFTENSNVTELNVDSKLTTIGKPIRTKREIVQHLDTTAESKLGEIINVVYPEISTGVSLDQLMLTGSVFSRNDIKPIVKDSLWNTYIVWSFEWTVAFWSTTLATSWEYNEDVFVAKINSSWNYERAIRWWWDSNDEWNWITVDWSGNIYIVWNFRWSATFWITTLIESSNSDNDVFVAKIDKDGNYLWAIKWWWNGMDQWNWITIDWSWNIYIVWSFGWTATFWSTTLMSNWEYDEDVFVAKIDKNSNRLWAIKWWWTSRDHWIWIAVDSLWNIYIVWSFEWWTTTFWSTTISKTIWYVNDYFLAKITSDFQRTSVKKIEWIEIISIFLDEQDSLYVWGFYGMYGSSIYIWSTLLESYWGEEPSTILYKTVPRDEPETILYETLPEAPQM